MRIITNIRKRPSSFSRNRIVYGQILEAICTATAGRTLADVRSMTPTRRYSLVEWSVVAVVTALGATMIVAWDFELVGLLQFVRTGPKLRFNNAALLILSGFALACSILSHRKTAEGIVCAALLSMSTIHRLSPPPLSVSASH